MEAADPAQLQLKLRQQEAILQCVQTMTHQMASLSTAVQAAHSSTNPWTVPAPAPTDLGSAPSPPAPSPRASPPTTGEVRWIPRGVQELPDPMAAHLQPPAQLLSHRRHQGGLHHHSTNWQSEEVRNSPAPSRHVVLCRICIGYSTRSTTGHDVGQEILRLRQGNSSVSDYSIEFQTLVTDSGWEGQALVHSFIHGLSEPIKDELLTRELPGGPGPDHSPRYPDRFSTWGS